MPGCGKDGASDLQHPPVEPGASRRSSPPALGLIKTDLSFDLFGSRRQHRRSTGSASGPRLGMFGIGQTYSNFMDIDVFPNTIDYWGPSGMVFVRNPQLRITPWSQGRHEPGVLARSAELGHRHRQDQRDLARFRRRLHRLEPAARPDRPRGAWIATGATCARPASCARSATRTRSRADDNPSGHKTGYGLNLTGAFNVLGKDQVTWQHRLAARPSPAT